MKGKWAAEAEILAAKLHAASVSTRIYVAIRNFGGNCSANGCSKFEIT
jgi:hypothetical protein